MVFCLKGRGAVGAVDQRPPNSPASAAGGKLRGSEFYRPLKLTRPPAANVG